MGGLKVENKCYSQPNLTIKLDIWLSIEIFLGSSEAEHLTVNQGVGISKFPLGAKYYWVALVGRKV